MQVAPSGDQNVQTMDEASYGSKSPLCLWQCLFFDLPLQGRKVDGISNYLIFDQPDGKHKSRYFTALYQKVTMSTGLIPRRAELNIYYGYLWRRGLL